MSPTRITSRILRTVAGQAGFQTLRLTEGNIVQSRLRQGRRTVDQKVGVVADAQGLLDFCRLEDIPIQDVRTPRIPAWVEDPWVHYGA